MEGGGSSERTVVLKGAEQDSRRHSGLEFDVNTFRGDLELAALGYLDSLGGFITGGGFSVLDLLDKLITLKDLAKNNVAAVEPAKIRRLAT